MDTQSSRDSKPPLMEGRQTIREAAGTHVKTRKAKKRDRKASPGKSVQRVQGTREFPETGPSFRVPEDRVRNPDRYGEAKDLGDLRTSDLGTLEAGIGEPLTAHVDEIDPEDAQRLREEMIEAVGRDEKPRASEIKRQRETERPRKLSQAIMNDVRRLQGIRSASRDAYREVRHGFSMAYREIRGGFVKARHEFSVGLDRAISKVLS